MAGIAAIGIIITIGTGTGAIETLAGIADWLSAS